MKRDFGCRLDKARLVALVEEEGLDEVERADLELHVSQCAVCAAELEQIRELQAHMRKLVQDEVDPPPELKARFDRFLWNEMQFAYTRRQSQKRWFKLDWWMGVFNETAWKVALPVFLVAGSFTLGVFVQQHREDRGISVQQLSELQQEVYDLRAHYFVSNLRSDNPSQRLQALAFRASWRRGAPQPLSLSEPDTAGRGIGLSDAQPRSHLTAGGAFDLDRELKLLLQILLDDGNANVRLAALKQLMDAIDVPEVRNGLILSLEQEPEPILQVTLIQMLSARGETRILPRLQRLLSSEGSSDLVKGFANEARQLLEAHSQPISSSTTINNII